MTIVKLCCHNFTQSAYFMIFLCVYSICHRPTDLSLLKQFSKIISFSNSYNLPSQSAIQKLSISTNRPTFEYYFMTNCINILYFPSISLCGIKDGFRLENLLVRGALFLSRFFFLEFITLEK